MAAISWIRRTNRLLLAVLLLTDSSKSPQSSILATLPFSGNGPIIEVKVNGRSLFMLLDTGASHTIIEKRLAGLIAGRAIKRFPMVDALSFQSSYVMYGPAVVEFGESIQANIRAVVAMDLQKWRDNVDGRINGIIGRDAVSQVILEVNSDLNCVRILPNIPRDSGEHFSASRKGMVLIRVAGQIEFFLVDTGALQEEVCITPELFAEVAKPLKEKATIGTGTSVGEQFFGILDEVDLGDLGTVRGVGAVTMPQNSLNYPFLRRFNTIFDLRRGGIWLKRASGFREPAVTRSVSSGMRIDRRCGATWVISVDPQSAAAKAGICMGDEVVSIDGVPVAGIPRMDFVMSMAPKRRVRIALSRKLKPVEVELILPAE